MSEFNFVNVPVPVERVEEVYALLSKPRAATPSITAQPATDVSAWSDEDLRRFYNESSTKMREALDYMLDSDEPVTTTAIAAALDLPKGANSVSGMFGAAGRRTANRYGHDLPWTAKWQFIDEAAGTTESVITIPDDIRQRLAAVRAGH